MHPDVAFVHQHENDRILRLIVFALRFERFPVVRRLAGCFRFATVFHIIIINFEGDTHNEFKIKLKI